ncbi:hypothetical protein DFS34DRAFT_312583 [Phlyctochytrium arcticum]|nr:hypothetical protein DFS34DRAFT_312583 [Phlyctochytrium arcticum]
METLTREYHAKFYNIYQATAIVQNTHFETHLPQFIRWYSVPRLYWTYPQESINKVTKTNVRRSSNHRNVSFTMLKKYILPIALRIILKDRSSVPIGDDVVRLGPLITSDEASKFLRFTNVTPPTTKYYKNCKVRVCYQEVFQDCIIVDNLSQFWFVTTVILEHQSPDNIYHAFACCQKLRLEGRDHHTGLPVYSRTQSSGIS